MHTIIIIIIIIIIATRVQIFHNDISLINQSWPVPQLRHHDNEINDNCIMTEASVARRGQRIIFVNDCNNLYRVQDQAVVIK